MRMLVLSAVAAVLLLAGGCSSDTLDPLDEKAARESLKSWLKLVDTGSYLASWHESDAYLHRRFERHDWQAYLLMYRMPLGELVRRREQRAYFSSSIPGLMEGQFFILEYVSDFEKHEGVKEKFTVIRNEKGQWHVGGYKADWRTDVKEKRRLY